MKSVMSVAATWVVLSVGAMPMQAQIDDAFREPGLWFQVGGGLLSMNAECPPCLVGRRSAIHATLSGGGSMSERFRLGVEALAMYSSGADTSREVQAAFAMGEVVPFPDLPITLRAGVGLGRYAQLTGADLLTTTGLAFTVGVAGELGLSRRFHLAPYARFVRGSGLPSKLNGLPQFTAAKLNILYFGLAVGWR